MSTSKALPEIPDEDSSPISLAPWLTHRRLTLFVIGWLVLFALLSVIVSNPFQSEVNASATPDYAKVMFLHGLLIGMCGLMALLTCQVMRLRSKHVRLWIAGGVVVATVLAAIGGIWDKTIPGSEVPMWTQIFGFFALDEILLLLVIGLIGEWRRGSPIARTFPFVAAILASASMLLAALMGHLAGWIMEFGNFPALIGDFSRFAGYSSIDDFTGALVGSHSHQMAIGVMALTIALVTQQFGHGIHVKASRILANIGMGMVILGTVVMTAIYVWSAFSGWSPPAWFVSGPNGVNGIASDDVVTGILVMGGGVITLVAFLLGGTLIHKPTRLAAAWSWVLSFATVVVAGYAIEMNTAFFGAGDQSAAGAANDAVFTWLHQDIGLFLLPAIVLIMLAAELLIDRSKPLGWIGWSTIAGITAVFLGGVVYVFITPSMFSQGYIIATIGLLVVGLALLMTLWWGAIGQAQRQVETRVHEPPLPYTQSEPEREEVKHEARV
jgi:hypothetical protein